VIAQLAEKLAHDAAWRPCRGEACPYRPPAWDGVCRRCYGLDNDRYARLQAAYIRQMIALTHADPRWCLVWGETVVRQEELEETAACASLDRRPAAEVAALRATAEA
jgi:hypothetical protein